MKTKLGYRLWIPSLTMIFTIVEVTLLDSNYCVLAQIIPDATLGAESSVVTPDNIKGIDSERISGGAVRGSNLFHSFQEFNIDEGKGAYFNNPAAIQNIFSRVTGGNPSEIMGRLGVLGNANLFFLNPNGILFGENASLDIRGSFLATTAESILFPDGNKFSALNPEAAPLLTVNVQQPIGLEFVSKEGIITNAANLTVASRQTLSLSGSDVATTGNLTAPGGKVELLGTNNVALLEDATIDVSATTGGGTILIGGDWQGKGTVPNAKRTYVGKNVDIRADALNKGNGGKVIVWADEVTGFYGNISARGGVESGNGGLVEVSGKEHLIFRGKVDTSALNGLPGTLLLDPTNIIIADGSGDEAGDGIGTFVGNNSGVEGSILTTPLNEIEDTAPTTIYESELEGLSGDNNIILQATNDITLQDLSDDRLDLAAGTGVITLSADADGNGFGDFIMEDNIADTIFTNGRDFAISGVNLIIGKINTVLESGNGGKITFSAGGSISTGDLDSSSKASAESDLFAVSAESGNGGNITLSAGGSISTGDLDSSSKASAESDFLAVSAVSDLFPESA
nr:filamentous hemagglutinin N-terminal domain-containing protein [Xenococcaceae cyanobacterium MO_188.B29]